MAAAGSSFRAGSGPYRNGTSRVTDGMMTLHEDAASSGGHPPRPERTSDVLKRLIRDWPGERISLHDLTTVMGDRAFAALILLFALPNCLPLGIPGLSAVLGAPIVPFAIGLMLGQNSPWLPAFLGRRSFRKTDFMMVFNKALPWLEKVERLLKPRCAWVIEGKAERLLGVILVILSIVLVLPIPFGNNPPAIAISVIALGLIERDGLTVLIGYMLGLISCAVAAAVVVALFKALVYALVHFLT